MNNSGISYIVFLLGGLLLNKEIKKNPLFLLGLFNFIMGIFFIFQDELIARPAAYLFQINFIILIYLAQKNQK